MPKGKMDNAAAARIRRARGENDEFARRAAIAARANKEGQLSKDELSKSGGQKGGGGPRPEKEKQAE